MSLNKNMLNPDMDSVNNLVAGLGGIRDEPKEELMTDDELDDLINSQLAKQESYIQPVQEPQPLQPLQPSQPQVVGTTQVTPTVSIVIPPEVPQANPSEETSEEATPPVIETIIDYDIKTMNDNLEGIRNETIERINMIKTNQNILLNKVALLEKFNIVDERELAIQMSKKEHNVQRIGQVQNALSRRMELLTNVLDLTLKYEDAILKWYKTIMEIEKDKVNAYQKIRSLTKAVTAVDGDVNATLSAVNNLIQTDSKHLLDEAKNELSLNGYGGKKFNN